MPALPGYPAFDDLAALAGADPMLTPAPNPAAEAAAAYAQELASDAPIEVAPPVPTLPQPLVPGLAPGGSLGQSQSQSVGTTALNQKTLEELQTGTRAKGWRGDIARAKAGRIAEAGALNANLDPAFQAREEAEQGLAAAKIAEAQDKAGDPNAAAAAANQAADQLGLAGVSTTGAAQRAIAQSSIIAKEQEEAVKAQLKAEGARAQYTEALNRVKSSVINPNRLVANQPLAFGLQNAVAAIAAISGKPGMTNFANMLNQGMLSAMSRDVDAQMAKLQQNQSVAAGFKQIYDMVVDENDTQAQARNKMYGAYLASMEGYIESQMGQHDSETINAQLGMTRAEIQAQRVAVENKNYTDALERAADDAKLITQKYGIDTQAAMTKAQIAESKAAREAAAKAKAAEDAKAAAQQAAGVAIISPITNEHQGQVKYADPKKAQDIATDINEKQGKAAVVLRSLDRVEQLNRGLTTGQLVGKDAVGARDAIVKELDTIKQLTASDMANIAGLKPLSDTDLKQMREAIGTESLKDNMFSSILGSDSSGMGSTEAVRDYMVRNMDNAFKVHLRQASPEEAGGVAQYYGSNVLYKGGAPVNVPIPTSTPGQFVNAPQNPAPGFAPYGPDYTEYTPQVSPGDTAMAEGHKNPPAKTVVDETLKTVAEYKPQDETLTATSKSDAPPFMAAFAKDMEKSGRGKTDQGANWESDLVGAEYLNVPHFADDVGKLANIAFFGDSPSDREDARAVLSDLASRTDDIGDLAEWAIKNPDRFDLAGLGSIVGGLVNETRK